MHTNVTKKHQFDNVLLLFDHVLGAGVRPAARPVASPKLRSEPAMVQQTGAAFPILRVIKTAQPASTSRGHAARPTLCKCVQSARRAQQGTTSSRAAPPRTTRSASGARHPSAPRTSTMPSLDLPTGAQAQSTMIQRSAASSQNLLGNPVPPTRTSCSRGSSCLRRWMPLFLQ